MSQSEQFIERWENSGAAERANYQLFLSELCDVLGVPHPDPATPDNRENAYVFERSVRFEDSTGHASTNFIDLYKRGCFFLDGDVRALLSKHSTVIPHCHCQKRFTPKSARTAMCSNSPMLFLPSFQ